MHIFWIDGKRRAEGLKEASPDVTLIGAGFSNEDNQLRFECEDSDYRMMKKKLGVRNGCQTPRVRQTSELRVYRMHSL